MAGYQFTRETLDTQRSRFELSINKTDSCWLWIKGTSHGYGEYYPESKLRSKPQLAHRCAWEIYCGRIPPGLWVLHKCDVRNCVNPEHLFLGTVVDNNADKMAKGRYRGNTFGLAHGVVAKPPTHYGTELWQTKLGPEKVKQIRIMYRPGIISLKAIGKLFGVSHSTIQAIIEGRTWKWI